MDDTVTVYGLAAALCVYAAVTLLLIAVGSLGVYKLLDRISRVGAALAGIAAFAGLSDLVFGDLVEFGSINEWLLLVSGAYGIFGVVTLLLRWKP